MKRLTWALVSVLTAAAVVGVLGATASTSAKGPGVVIGPYEIQPDAGKDVNRDVPSTKSKSNAPRVVPGQASKVASSNPGATGFAGLNFQDQRTADNGNQFSLEPPDQGLCEGNGLVIEPVNDVFTIYTTGGSVAPGSSTTSLTEFFTGQPQIVRSPTVHYGPFLSDPRCYYDPATHRFFMSILQFAQDPNTGAFGGPSYEDLAVSKSSSPTTNVNDWYQYKINTTNDGSNGVSHPGCPCFGDQPLLGADTYGIYITSNEYSINGPEFNGAQVYAIDKRDAENGKLTYQYVAGKQSVPLAEGVAYSLQPATSPNPGSWSTANNGTEYLMSSLDFNATTDNRIAVWALTNTKSLDTSPNVTLSAPAIVSTETYGQPPNAQQKKGPIPLGSALGDPENQLATNDDRMNQVVYADGNLFGAVNTMIRTSNGASTQTDRSGIAYFIIKPSTSGTSTVTVSGSVTKQGYVALGNNDNVLFPSIAVNASGKGEMAFSISGQHYYPSAAYAPIDDVNGVGDIHIGAAGTVPADGFTGYAAEGGDGVERWGDYSAAVPGDNGTIWLASEWIPGTFGYPPFIANWGTFINSVQP